MRKHNFLGPIFGSTTDKYTTLWLRGIENKEAFIRFRQNKEPWQITTIKFIKELDFTGVCKLKFNESEKRMEIEAILLDTGSEKTLPNSSIWERNKNKVIGSVSPAPDSKQEISFLFGSCAHRGYGLFRQGDKVFKTIINKKHHLQNDFFLMAGDQVYADHPINNLIPLFPWFWVNTAPKSLKIFFERYRNDFSRPNFRELLSSLPVYMMFDDHEVENNWGGFKYRHEVIDAGDKLNPQILKNGMTAYLAYQALHSENFSQKSIKELIARINESPKAKKNWGYKFSYGLADFIILDVRTERTDPKSKTPQMLSEEQILKIIEFINQDNVDEADLRYKFIVSPVPIAPDTNHDVGSGTPQIDTWRSYPEQRDRILKECVKAKLRPIFLGGDLHVSTCLTIRSHSDQKFEVPTIISSGLNWITFGIQRESQNDFALHKIEKGTLVTETADLKRDPFKRKGDFYVDGFELMKSCMRNNYMRINVTKNSIIATIYKAKDGSIHDSSWVYEKTRLLNHNIN